MGSPHVVVFNYGMKQWSNNVCLLIPSTVLDGKFLKDKLRIQPIQKMSQGFRNKNFMSREKIKKNTNFNFDPEKVPINGFFENNLQTIVKLSFGTGYVKLIYLRESIIGDV